MTTTARNATARTRRAAMVVLGVDDHRGLELEDGTAWVATAWCAT